MEEIYGDVGIDVMVINYMFHQMTHINFAATLLVDELVCSDTYDEDMLKTIKDIVRMSDMSYV